jgi:hydrogenase maturation protease
VRTLILGLGNDLIADDGIGIAAALAVAPLVAGRAEVHTTALHGIALLEELLGFDCVIILDACRSGENPPGTIRELALADLPPVIVPSPHYTGLPEMYALAKQFSMDFPKDIRILAVEAVDLESFGGEMTPAVRAAIPEMCRRVLGLLADAEAPNRSGEPTACKGSADRS